MSLSSEETPVIRLSGVTRSYSTAKGSRSDVLRGIDLEVFPGEYVAIVGPSGAGKSTLLNILGMLETPSSGTYELAGVDTKTLTRTDADRLRSQTIGFVFQDSYMLPERTVAENIELGLRIQGVRRTRRESVVRDAAETVRVDKRLRAPARSLSGGERQRTAFARAIATSPGLILADEPTGNLDTRNSENILALLGELHAAGVTVIVITHDERVARAASRQIRVSDGVVESDTGPALPESVRTPTTAPIAKSRRSLDTLWDCVNSVVLRPVRSILLVTSFLIGAAGLVAATAINQTAAVQVADRITQAGLDEVRIGSPTGIIDATWMTKIASLPHVSQVAALKSVERSSSPLSRFDPAAIPTQTITTPNTLAVTASYFASAESTVHPASATAIFAREDLTDVAILGRNLAESLGIRETTLPQSAWIGAQKFTVIGIADESERSKAAADTAFVPMQSGVGTSLYYVVRTEPGYPAIVSAAIPLALSPENPGAISISTVADLANLQLGVQQDLSVLVAVVAVVLLAMAILGAAATMNLSVNSRTREIALRRALGASRSSVAKLFVYEGSLMGLSGGILGVTVGLAGGATIASLRGWSFSFPVLSIVVGIGAGLFAGMIASLLPSALAARIDPAQALKMGD